MWRLNKWYNTDIWSTHGIHLAKRGMVIMGILIGHHFKHKDPKLARNGFIWTTVPISIYWLISFSHENSHDWWYSRCSEPFLSFAAASAAGLFTSILHSAPESTCQENALLAAMCCSWQEMYKCNTNVVTSSEMFGYLFYSVSWYFNGILMCFEGDSMPIPLYVISVLAESPNATDS